MTGQLLYEVLEATGYLADGQPAHGVRIGNDAHVGGRARSFRPDALWKGDSALTVYFKSEPEVPPAQQIAGWHREIWNQGFAPLLWVVSPEKIELYNGFGRPRQTGNAAEHRLRTFERIESKLEELDAFAGRLAMETGRFWQEPQANEVDRKTSVDRQLLSDLAALERDLVSADMSRPDAQGLIGRSIFTQYLIDRRIVTTRHLAGVYGHGTLAAILRDRRATKRLFDRLREVFNGDMFPSEGASVPRAGHLRRVADFLEADDPKGQMTFFPYQFDVIPVELISSIYEQFARSDPPARDDERSAKSDSSARDDHHETDVFYTRLPLVSLVLDEITDGLTGKETVLDLTCGSGVFLVEALRRLVRLRSGGAEPNRRLIRSTLHKQIYGVDISEAAVRVAAFSLYLAALELDPNPKPLRALKFKPLIGKTLIVGDARNVEQTADGQAVLTKRGAKRRFDVIVGNPPWSYGGREATAARRDESNNRSRVHAPRGESLGFVSRAMEFASDSTRFGLILSAVQFFSRSGTGAAASRQLIEQLSPVTPLDSSSRSLSVKPRQLIEQPSPVTLVNLSNQSDWLFPNANTPAVALFARHRPSPSGTITTVQVPWSPGGARSHTFEIAPSDIVTLPLADWKRQPEFLKAALLGCRRDLALLDRLTSKLTTLEEGLGQIDVRLRAGLKLGNRSRDTGFLHGIPYLTAKDLQPFSEPADLSSFDEAGAEGPRSRNIYRAPLLLAKRFLLGENVRPVVAVANRDTVFTDAFLGAAFPENRLETAYLLAAVLSSSLASWFLLMTASTFGLWMRLIERGDLARMPVPDLETAPRSEAGRRLIRLVRKLQRNPPRDADWRALDDAVFDLYGLDEAERTVARDGLFRASWQWKPGRLESAKPALAQPHMLDYARTFLSAMDVWFAARRQRHMRAEVFDLPDNAPLRVVRFVLKEGHAPSIAELVEPEGSLRDVLDGIGRRLEVRLATSLSGQRELRVHGRREVVIIKPNARRHWMGVSALEDADAVIVESFSGAAA